MKGMQVQVNYCYGREKSFEQGIFKPFKLSKKEFFAQKYMQFKTFERG